MAAFRFRAQVALELRHKQDEEAQRALGVARRATSAAQDAQDRAERDLAEAHQRASEEEARASDTTRAIWHRNWLKRQQAVIAAARSTVDARRVDERNVAERAMETRRRLRSLERLRDRIWKAFQAAERRAEQKEFDALGGLRYVARRDVPEGA
jgi:flagellar biosynthesis chaperone FliJ